MNSPSNVMVVDFQARKVVSADLTDRQSETTPVAAVGAQWRRQPARAALTALAERYGGAFVAQYDEHFYDIAEFQLPKAQAAAFRQALVKDFDLESHLLNGAALLRQLNSQEHPLTARHAARDQADMARLNANLARLPGGPKFLLSRAVYYDVHDGSRAGARRLWAIHAVKPFGDVEAGEPGGLLETPAGLAHDGECWVETNGVVLDQAGVSGNARIKAGGVAANQAVVYGFATIGDDCHVLDSSRVSGHARLTRGARLTGACVITGQSAVRGPVTLSDQTVAGRLLVGYNPASASMIDVDFSDLAAQQKPVQNLAYAYGAVLLGGYDVQPDTPELTRTARGRYAIANENLLGFLSHLDRAKIAHNQVEFAGLITAQGAYALSDKRGRASPPICEPKDPDFGFPPPVAAPVSRLDWLRRATPMRRHAGAERG
jgi:hypothetical protein